MIRVNIEDLIKEGKMCKDWNHKIPVSCCTEYKTNLCPLECSYAHKRLNSEGEE